jgi:hypothetical protein
MGALTASIDSACLDGELLEWTAQALELKALIVVVAVRITRATGSCAVLVILTSSVSSGRDLAGRVVVVATGGSLSSASVGSGADGDSQGEKGGERELHVEHYLRFKT